MLNSTFQKKKKDKFPLDNTIRYTYTFESLEKNDVRSHYKYYWYHVNQYYLMHDWISD